MIAFAPGDASGRLLGIGGSDAGAVAGVSPYRTPYDLWEEKTQRVPPPDLSENIPVSNGIIMEPVIRSELIPKHYPDYPKIMRDGRTYFHKGQTYLYCHIDGKVVGDAAIAEIKNVGINSKKFWGKPGTDQIPPQVRMQCVHMLTVMPDINRVDVWAFIAGSDLYLYPIYRDPVLQDAYLQKAATFWDCVTTDIPPPPETNKDFNKSLPTEKVTVLPYLQDNEEIGRLCQQHAQLCEQLATLEEARAKLGVQLRTILAGTRGYRDDTVDLLLIQSSRRKFNTKKFLKDHPEKSLDKYGVKQFSEEILKELDPQLHYKYETTLVSTSLKHKQGG